MQVRMVFLVTRGPLETRELLVLMVWLELLEMMVLLVPQAILVLSVR